MFRRVLIANRGEVALRILRTLREMDVEGVLVCSESDARFFMPHAVKMLCIGGDDPAHSYLNPYRIINAAVAAGTDAVHPGYGFLSEDATFARLCLEMGLAFIGPSPETLRSLGDKASACRLASEVGLPTLLMGVAHGEEEVARMMEMASCPVVLKPVMGGGGKGIRVVHRLEDVEEAWRQARKESATGFRDGGIYVERYLAGARHLEVQVARDARGNVISFPLRECSIQRRHQKWVEESPAPSCPEHLEKALLDGAEGLAGACGLVGIATVEFLVRGEEFFFLEVNPRLQVEHTVTEMLCGMDLVREQVRIACGEELENIPIPRGHAMESRVYGYPRGAGACRLDLPGGNGIRVDAPPAGALAASARYDGMLAKICSWSPTREMNVRRMQRALEETAADGLRTNLPELRSLLESTAFRRGRYDLSTLEKAAGDGPAGPLPDKRSARKA
ncbi:MAG: biotin carboxylase N-terminal domain-containing protein [Actinomycetota bacterium]|nr:biotin carboxylase N-terminal domain-containing protein [Actinomycetota bacterium]